VVWLASDIHLGPDAPATRGAFLKFLDSAAQQADALVLCGDIFDAWIGDDAAVAAPPDWLREVLHSLQKTSNAIPLWLGRGNRDFLMGERLASHLGAHLLPDPCRILTDLGPVLVSHGDEYCTADTQYQRFRKIVRSDWVQRLFLGLGLNLRRKIALWARERSRASGRGKRADIMDVAPEAIHEAFRNADVEIMVHGHTHRPARHGLRVDGRNRSRYVLPDWECDHASPPRGGWLAIDRNGITARTL